MDMRLTFLFAGMPPFTLRKIPGIHFCYRLSGCSCQSGAGRIRSTEKFSDLITNRQSFLPTCSIVLQLPKPDKLKDQQKGDQRRKEWCAVAWVWNPTFISPNLQALRLSLLPMNSNFQPTWQVHQVLNWNQSLLYIVGLHRVAGWVILPEIPARRQ
jgi:hypothetical protein